jgi:hypothetical protein
MKVVTPTNDPLKLNNKLPTSSKQPCNILGAQSGTIVLLMFDSLVLMLCRWGRLVGKGTDYFV